MHLHASTYIHVMGPAATPLMHVCSADELHRASAKESGMWLAWCSTVALTNVVAPHALEGLAVEESMWNLKSYT